MYTGGKCQQSSRLELLLHEQLSEGDESAVLHHLSECEKCRRALESLAAGSALWGELPEQLAHRLEKAGATDVFDGGDRTDQTPIEVERLQEYLGPSDDPNMLGRIGSYEVCGLVGQGSMGVVVKAWEPALNRYVAIKMLAPAYASSGSARRRFERESRAVAAVSHEHVVPIFAVDEYRGVPYIVMQYVAGPSLHQRLEREGPLDTCQAARIGLQVASGLAAAHAQGIVHRDIKPANVMLENSVDRVLVTDFGLARVADEANMTRSGIIAGTPQFMSPEQARGESVDHRSDLFSLGSTLYAACTGRPPFRAETVFGVIQRVCEHEPRPIRDINPETADWLASMINKLMSKRREDRFESATEVAELLSHELAHMQNPIAVQAPKRAWRQEPKPKELRRRNSPRVALLTAAIVALIAGGLSWNFLASDNQAAPTQLVAVLQAPAGSGTSVEALPKFDLVEEKTLPARAGGTLTLLADRGHVEVLTNDGQQVQVKLERKIAAENAEAAKAIAAMHRVAYSAADGGVSVTAEMDPEIKQDWRKNPFRSVKYTITVPRRFDLNLATAGGHITIKDNVTGKVQVKSTGGHLTLANVDGPIKARTAGGHITAKDVNGEADLDTAGGNIHVGNVQGRVIAKTSGGNITVANTSANIVAKTSGGNVSAKISKQPQNDCDLSTSGGNVSVQIARGLALNIDAATNSGRLSAPFGRNGRPKNKVKTELNGGGPLLKARTGGGNINFSYLKPTGQGET